VRGYDMFHKDRYAATLLATILGGKTSSRLFQEIREKYGLAYALSANSETYTDSGYLSVYAGVPHAKLKEVVERIARAFKKIRINGVSGKELTQAKDFYRGHFAIGLESSDEVASFFGGQELFYKKVVQPEEVLAKIAAVTEADITRVAKYMFHPNFLNLVVIGPHKNEPEFLPLLAL